VAREYVVSAAGITVAGATTLILIKPSAAAPSCALEILRMWVGQSDNATSKQQRIRVNLQSGTAPTLIGATPAKLKQMDPVSQIVSGTVGAAGTVGINASVESGTKTTMFEDVFNVLNGWLWVATPKETLIIPASSTTGLGLDFPVSPGSPLTNWAFGMTYAELG